MARRFDFTLSAGLDGFSAVPAMAWKILTTLVSGVSLFVTPPQYADLEWIIKQMPSLRALFVEATPSVQTEYKYSGNFPDDKFPSLQFYRAADFAADNSSSKTINFNDIAVKPPMPVDNFTAHARTSNAAAVYNHRLWTAGGLSLLRRLNIQVCRAALPTAPP